MRFRRQALKRNDRGEEVVRLQTALQALGYDVGQIDGVFGYLTHDALRQFQREHRLRVDGKAGPEVRAVLYRPELTAMRRIHVVGPKEHLIDIARDYGVTVEYLRRTNRLPARRPLYEGQRLFIRGRYVIGAVRALVDARDAAFTLRRFGRYLSALGGLQFKLVLDGTIEGEWNQEAIAMCSEHGVEPLAVVHNWDAAGQPEAGTLEAILRRRPLRLGIVKQIRQLACFDGVGGVVLDLGALHFGDGGRFVRFVSEVGDVVGRAGKQLFVSVPVMQPGIKGGWMASDINWTRLNKSVDGVIVQSHRRIVWDQGVPRISQFERSLRSLFRHVPPWKIILGASLGGREYHYKTRMTRDLSYQRSMAIAYMRGLRPTWDEPRGLLTATYIAEEAEDDRRTLWIENGRSIEAKLRWVERYHLKGLFLWPLGDEDGRVWQVVPQWIKAWRHESDEHRI